MDFHAVVRSSTAPLLVGLVGAAAAWGLADAASAKGFAVGAVLVALALLISGGFYTRVAARNAGRVLIRLALASLLKWMVLMGGAFVVLSQGLVSPAAFTFGVIAGLLSAVFNTAKRSSHSIQGQSSS